MKFDVEKNRKELGETRIPFGKYRGDTLDDIASTDEGLRYLDWLAGQVDLRTGFGATLTKYVALDVISRAIDRAIEDGDPEW